MENFSQKLLPAIVQNSRAEEGRERKRLIGDCRWGKKKNGFFPFCIEIWCELCVWIEIGKDLESYAFLSHSTFSPPFRVGATSRRLGFPEFFTSYSKRNGPPLSFDGCCSAPLSNTYSAVNSIIHFDNGWLEFESGSDLKEFKLNPNGPCPDG